MNSTNLITFLDCPDGPQQFKRAAAEPLAIFRRAVTSTGYSSAPVELMTQKITLVLKAMHLRRLCEWYLAGDIDAVEIEYIATALALCPDFVFESEGVKDAVYSISELRQLKPHEREKIQAILDSLT